MVELQSLSSYPIKPKDTVQHHNAPNPLALIWSFEWRYVRHEIDAIARPFTVDFVGTSDIE
jgi:hypothetical protein